MRLLAFAFCLTLIPSCEARAGTGVAGADILKLPVEARGWGMGTAYSALADDVGAMAYNPAGLSLVVRREARFTYLSALEGSSYKSVLLAHPAGRWGALGLMILGHNVSDINNEGDTFFPLQGVLDGVSVDNYAFGAYASCRFSHLLPSLRMLSPLSFGYGIKFLRLTVANLKTRATASDIGFLLILEPYVLARRRQVRFALVAQNLGGGFTYPGTYSEPDALPQTLRLGAAAIPFEDSKSSLSISLENASYVGVSSRQRFTWGTIVAREQMNLLGLGVEYWRLRRMAVRMGYVLPWGGGADDNEAAHGIALGGTFRLFTNGQDFQFDLAYRPIQFGTSTQDAVSISAGVRF